MRLKRTLPRCTARNGVAASADCPYLEHPLPECYCRDLCRRAIPKMVRYCLNRHLPCPIRTTGEGKDGPGEAIDQTTAVEPRGHGDTEKFMEKE